MEDKEIGKLWGRAQIYEGPSDSTVETWQNFAEELILKLIEERAELLYYRDPYRDNRKWEELPDKIGTVSSAAKEKYRRQARSNFGIDPKLGLIADKLDKLDKK